MRTWIEIDDNGREFLSRTGVGTVVAVSPVGIVGPGDEHTIHLVEIDCEPERGVICLRARAHVCIDDELFGLARSARDSGCAVIWAIQWHRHDWVPGHLPIVALDLATDARGRLVELRPADVDAGAPDFVPASWERLQS